VNKTQCDLSFNEATLDYQAMISTATICVGAKLEAIHKHASQVRTDCEKQYPTGIHLNAEGLLREANQLQTACEVLATLIGGKDRENITIVNK